MPNPTKASLNSLRQATPALEIHGPTAHELPATWLYGETIPLTATGGNGRYQWLTTAPEAASIRHRQDNRCEAVIEGTAAAQILAFSAGDRAIYKGIQGTQPLLKAVDNRPRHYLEAQHCYQQAGGSLPTKKTIEDILTARKTAVIAWAQKSFAVTLGTSPSIWLHDEAHSGTPSINLETAAYADHTAAIETKKHAIEAKKNSLQVLKAKEQALLAKGATLPEDEIRKNAELAGFEEVVKQNELVYDKIDYGIRNPKPNEIGKKIIEKFVNEALAEHREKQMALSELRETLHTAQGDIQRQWEALTALKIQQAKDSVTTYTLCQFNPATFDQAVVAWVADTGEATPGDRFTPGPFSSQRNGDSPPLPCC